MCKHSGLPDSTSTSGVHSSPVIHTARRREGVVICGDAEKDVCIASQLEESTVIVLVMVRQHSGIGNIRQKEFEP